MSKKSTTKTIEIPAQYQGFDLRLLKKEHASRKIIIDPTGKIHAFKDETTVVPPEIQIDREFLGLDKFTELPTQTILAYHEQFFKSEPPKKQNKITTALYIWAYMLREATPHLANTNPVTGEKTRVSSVAGRKYFKGSEFGKPNELKTYQALQCLALFTELIGDNPSITEEQLKAHVIKEAARLKTRQDPWRIFQYYRPKLISLHLLRYE
ncbi:MAG TPA: hypothetical protein PLO50_00915 [Nitrospira sp.]|nr:hypothetical protein [Nitrospira sp.]